MLSKHQCKASTFKGCLSQSESFYVDWDHVYTLVDREASLKINFSRERAKRFFTEQNERSGTLIEILLRPKLLRNKAIEISAMNSQSSINWVQIDWKIE